MDLSLILNSRREDEWTERTPPSSNDDSVIADSAGKRDWDENEDLKLLDMRWQKYKWKEIGQKLGRSDGGCRSRYIMKYKPNWNSRTKKRFAKSYLAHRQEMLKQMAEELDKPWQTVEIMLWSIGKTEILRLAEDEVDEVDPQAPRERPLLPRIESSKGSSEEERRQDGIA